MGKWWFGTLNNWTLEEWHKVIEYKFEYMIVGSEVGEEGTPHLHFVYKFHSDKKFEVLKKYLERVHWEPVNDIPKCITYCKKGGKFYEFGFHSLKDQGKRNDLESLSETIMNGASWGELAEEMPGMIIKYPKGIQKLMDARDKPKMRELEVTWYFGKSGSGKTFSVYNSHPLNEIYMKDGTPWWDGYEGQDVILIDDFDGRWPFRDLLRLLQPYPYQGQVKGGYRWITASVIYITCDRSPEEVYKDPNDDNILAQILRRLSYVIEIKREVGGNTKITHLDNKNPENRNIDENI